MRAISDGKLMLTNRFETRASLVSLKLMKIVFNAMNKYDFGSLSILTEWFRQIEALVVLAKTMTNIATCVINANGDSFKFFHFPEEVRKKERIQRWKASSHRSASFVYTKDNYVHKNKQE